jgi:hypothetical protein
MSASSKSEWAERAELPPERLEERDMMNLEGKIDIWSFTN